MEKLKGFLLGVASALALLFVVMANGQAPLTSPLGRYQPIATTGSLFVVDTATGTTKVIWASDPGWVGQLGIPFNNLPNAPSAR